MAKHKTKKSPPTPSPEDSKKIEKSIENEDLPPTEKITENTPEPKIETVISDENKRKLDKLFWLRVGLAVIGGFVATFLFDSIEGEERRWASIGFMIILFIFSIFVGKSMRLQLPRSDRKKLVTTAIGSYVFIYLFSWIISYTLVNLSETGMGITSPLP